MRDIDKTQQDLDADEQPLDVKALSRRSLAFIVLRLLAAGVAGWSVWAFAASRMVWFTFLEGNQTLTTGYVLYVLSPNNVALVLILASTEMLFAKRRAVRILAIVIIPVASVILSLQGQTSPSWDPGAYIFVIIGLFAAVSVVATHRATAARAYKLAAPVLAATLILLTLAVSPGVPQSAYTSAATKWDRDAVEYKCADPASDYDRQDRVWSIMMAPSLCSDVAAYELSKAKDDCYSASEAYAHLALAQGANADNPSYAVFSAQTDLTAAWLRGRDEMESGFCVQTKNKVRTFTRSDGSGLFSVGVTEWEDIRD
jgi:uncharacterized membrane protein